MNVHELRKALKGVKGHVEIEQAEYQIGVTPTEPSVWYDKEAKTVFFSL